MPNGLTLYDLEEDYAALLDTEEVVTSEQEAEFRIALMQSLKSVVEKRERCAQFRAHLIDQQDFASAEIKRLQDRKKRLENAQKRFDGYIQSAMQALDLKKLEALTCVISLRACPDSVEITDDQLVPAKFKTIKTETVISKSEIKKALQSGEDVPGADLKIGGVTLVVR